MEVIENIKPNPIKAKKPIGKIGKVIISIILAFIPIALSATMTFVSLPLRGLYVFLIGILIGILLIPFMLFITKQENWAKKWYIWIGMITVIIIVLVFPMVKSTGMPSMQGEMQEQGQGNVMMEKGMY